jgi:hypothetical protein
MARRHVDLQPDTANAAVSLLPGGEYESCTTTARAYRYAPLRVRADPFPCPRSPRRCDRAYFSGPGNTQKQFTFPRLDIRCAMAQSYRIVRNECCHSSPGSIGTSPPAGELGDWR